MIAGAAAIFSDKENIRRLLGLDEDQPNEAFRENLMARLHEDPRMGEFELPPHVLEDFIFRTLKEGWDQFATQLPSTGDVLEPLAGQFEETIKHGHNKAVSEILSKSSPFAPLLDFAWTIEAAPSEGAIMPDCIAMAAGPDGILHPFLLGNYKAAVAIVVPLSSSRLLVGRKEPAPGWLDLTKINQESAACSHSFFGASSNDAAFADLAVLIGTRSQEGIEGAIGSALESFLPPVSRLGDVLEPPTEASPWGEAPHNQQFSYEVSLYDFGDKELADRVGGVLQQVIQLLAMHMPLSRLEGFTFGADYPGALASIDRGIPGVKPPSTASKSIGIGVAQAVVVQREGLIKARVVMAGGLAMALIGETDELEGSARWALHTLVHELALVAMIQLMDEALPGEMLKPVPDPYEALLYPYCSSAPDGYVASRESAPYGDQDEILATYRELLASTLNRAAKVIPKARLSYRAHGDLDRLLETVMPLVRYILEFGAKLLGHCDGIEAAPFAEGDELSAALDQNGLRNWLTTFQADLRRFSARAGEWKSLDEWLAFNRHVERVLWQFGMFAFRGENGLAHIKIPYRTDAEAMLRTPEMHEALKGAEAQATIAGLPVEVRLAIAQALSEPAVPIPDLLPGEFESDDA